MLLIRRLACCLLAGWVVSSCAEPPSESENDRQLIVRHEALLIYPDASQVRLRVHDEGYDDDGKMRFSDPDGVELTGSERQRLEAAFRQQIIVQRPDVEEETYAAACFVPHHFFDYLNNEGDLIGTIAVCFCCDGASFRPSVGRTDSEASIDENIQAVKSLVSDMKLPTDVGCHA